MGKTAESYADLLLALCVFREARGQSHDAKLGVKHVILNRAAHPSGPFHNCHDVISNILAPRQFSSFNSNDPNASILPNPKNDGDWKAWLDCCDVVDSSEPDPTDGANYYYSIDIHPPAWANETKFTKQIERFKFYKL